MFEKSISRRSFLTISAMTAASLALDMDRVAAYASKMGPKEDYPTVIIGAGLGGLCCGAYLARQGIPVTVVEQHGVPGGYATSFDRAGGKFTFEVSLHGMSINNNNGPYRTLKNLGVLDQIELVALPEVYRLKAPGLDISVPQQDPEAYIRLLTKHFPKEAEGIRGFVGEMIDLSEEVERYSLKGTFTKTVLKIIFPIQFPNMWKLRNKTLGDLLDEYLEDPAAKSALSALWGYYGLPPSKLSGFYYANATGGYLKNGSFTIKNRSQDLSYALADVIENSGGKILYETAAAKIRVKEGKAAGVLLSDGRNLAARAVVSNASALTTFKNLLPPGSVPADYMKKLEAYRPSLSSFLVWLGLNRELRGKIKGFSTHVTGSLDAEADYQACMKGEIDKGSFGVAIYDNLFEGYSRPGTSSLMLIFLSGYGPWRKFEGDYRAGRKQAYYKEKDRWTNILIQRAEKELMPGLSSMIEVREAATPLTNRRYTGNTEGAIYGFEQSMDNAFMNRIRNKTPIEGLYLASAWGNPGGGYAGVLHAGEWTFQKMMEHWGGAS